MTHLHITSWLLAIILCLIVFGLYKRNNEKSGKILHMISRLNYLILLFSGGSLLFEYFKGSLGQTGEVSVKVIVGLWVIAAMEMIAVKAQKGESTKSLWIQFVIAAAIAIFLGFFRLPLGYKFM